MKRRSYAVGLVTVVAIWGCNEPGSTTAPTAAGVTAGDMALAIVSGNTQSAPAGTQLPQPLVVQVTDKHNHPIAKAVVNFVVVSGGGSMFGGAEETDKEGDAQDLWTLGPTIGSQEVQVRAVNPRTGEEEVYGTFNATGTATWRVVSGTPSGPNMDGLFIGSTGRVYSTGPQDGEMTEFNGSAWVTLPSGTTNGIKRMFGFSDADIYATGGNFAGSASVLLFNGTNWVSMPGVPQDQYITDIWGTGPTNLYATRVDGSVIYYNGSGWTVLPTPATNRLEAIWGFGPADIYAVGDGGTAVHYDGTSWTTLNLGTTAFLSDVWGSAPFDVYVVGDNGIMHFDGSSWTTTFVTPVPQLKAIRGTSASDIMTVGLGGVIYHYDGTSWSMQPSGTTTDLFAVLGSAPGDYYAVGGVGTAGATPGAIVLHYSP